VRGDASLVPLGCRAERDQKILRGKEAQAEHPGKNLSGEAKAERRTHTDTTTTTSSFSTTAIITFTSLTITQPTMPGLKRKAPSQATAAGKPSASATAAASSTKKPRSAESFAPAPPSALVDSQVDFPRGGGSGLTPFEHASTLREVRSEMASSRRGDGELFAEGSTSKKTLNPEDEKKRREERKKLGRDKQNAKKKKSFTPREVEDTTAKTRHQKDHIRIEHLNYKVSILAFCEQL
jgi:hypothetical protein